MNLKRWTTILLASALAVGLLGFGAPAAVADLHPSDCYDAVTGALLDDRCGDFGDLGEGAAQQPGAETTFAAQGDPVGPAVSTFTWTPNMTPLGYSARVVPASGTGSGRFNSDLAFWGNYVYAGHYDGFRVIDASDPSNPTQIINYTACAGDQGDVAVWGNLLFRAWNSAATAATCGGLPVIPGFEGVHIFDVSQPASPVLVSSVRMTSDTTPAGAGSHTLTLVPDVARGNVYIYVSASSGSTFDIVRVPLSNPAGAVYVRREPAGRACHDTSVFLADVNLVVCSGGNGFTGWTVDPSLPPSAVGGLEDPLQIYSVNMGVSIAHSAAFTYDGKVLVFGHEPGGGGQAQCQATSSTTNKSIFFRDARTGAALGSFVLPRPQTSTENCTWHNFDVVPTNRGYVLVAGNYQAGISVVDFTNPATAREIAYADPAPLSPTSIVLGGDWSSYWYDGHIYEHDITRGLIIWALSDRLANGTRTLDHLNPQTQEVSILLDKTAPTTTASLAPAAVNGWYVNPTVTLSADDGPDGAGVDKTEYSLDGGAFTTYTAPFQVTGDGDHTLDYRSSDFALNVETKQSLAFEVDATPPTVTVTPDRAPDRNGWYNHAVSFAVAGTDATSGIDSCESDVTYGGPDDGAATVSRSCTDQAGNTGSGSQTFRYDATAPTIAVTTPPDGASYLLNEFVAADYGCGDNLSGVDSCVGTTLPGGLIDTGSVGSHSYAVTAIDQAGNTNAQSATYNVRWPFTGFFSPVANPPTVNLVKAGSGVPVKFSLGADYGLAILAAGYPQSQPIACDTQAPTNSVTQTVTANSALSYDKKTNQYTYNWKTNKSWANSCRQFDLKLIDNTVHTALFRFTK